MKRLFFFASILAFMLCSVGSAYAGYSYGYRFPYSDKEEHSTYYMDYLKSVSPSLTKEEKEELDKVLAAPIIAPLEEKPKEKPPRLEGYSKHSIGVDLYGSAFLPMVKYEGLSNSGFNSIAAGGGIGLRYKANINKYFGLMLNLSYNANYSIGLNDFAEYKESFYLSHAVNLQFLLAVQRELPKASAGFVPIFGIGLDFSTLLGYSGALNSEAVALLSGEPNSMPVTVAPGVVALLGFRYNFSNNLFFGVSAIYHLNFLYPVAGTQYMPNDSSLLDRMSHSFKLSIEIGVNL